MSSPMRNTSQPLHGGFSDGAAPIASLAAGDEGVVGAAPSGHSGFSDMN
jgi:hypothetical protein